MNTLRQGSTLQGGRYIIKKVLGQGGFGITYLAEHTLLGVDVAIKEFFMIGFCNRDESSFYVYASSFANVDVVNSFRHKFLNEARKTAHFRHTNIIRISDVFEENGTAYYVMDYCEKGSLEDLLIDNPSGISEESALTYIHQVASAIQYIHEQYYNHLDIKPSNILLDSRDTIQLIDFGMTKHYDAAGSQTSTTPVGISHGYAAIEQYRQGGVSQFSPTTDIYSLGATLYKLVTGQTPPEASIIGEEGLPSFAASTNIKCAIENAMHFRRSDRPQTVKAWLDLFDGIKPHSIKEETIIIPQPISTPPSRGKINGHEWIDLGLSVKWATCNVGTIYQSDSGGRYSWGDASIKNHYIDYNYFDYKKKYGYNYKKGIVRSSECETYGLGKQTKIEPDSGHDAARENWGGSWRMPTFAEFEELIKYCKWTFVKNKGFNIMGPNGNCIFLPGTGSGRGEDYWTNTLSSTDSGKAYVLTLDSTEKMSSRDRYNCLRIRAVTE